MKSINSFFLPVYRDGMHGYLSGFPNTPYQDNEKRVLVLPKKSLKKIIIEEDANNELSRVCVIVEYLGKEHTYLLRESDDSSYVSVEDLLDILESNSEPTDRATKMASAFIFLLLGSFWIASLAICSYFVIQYFT